MPGVDGFEVLERMRSSEATVGIPVLVLTAKDLTRNDLERLSSNNVSQLVQKGDIDREGLLGKARQMLGIEVSAGAEPPKTVPPKEIGRKPVVLVIEDNRDNLTTAQAILNESCRVLEAPDGEQGLCLAQDERPDLIFLDISLPGLDGYSVIRLIREDSYVRDIPIIALTARAMIGDKKGLLEAGCDDYLSKPVEPSSLLAMVKKWNRRP